MQPACAAVCLPVPKAPPLAILLCWAHHMFPASPLAALQAVVAWLSVAVQYHGQPLEQSPRSVLGYFFATYWEGSPEQCGTDAATSAAAVDPPAANGAGALQAPGGSGMLSLSAVGGQDGAAADAVPSGGCTLCCFPAAAVIAHALFTLAFLAALWVTCSRLADAVLNNRLKRRMRIFQIVHSLLAVGGESLPRRMHARLDPAVLGYGCNSVGQGLLEGSLARPATRAAPASCWLYAAAAVPCTCVRCLHSPACNPWPPLPPCLTTCRSGGAGCEHCAGPLHLAQPGLLGSLRGHSGCHGATGLGSLRWCCVHEACFCAASRLPHAASLLRLHHASYLSCAFDRHERTPSAPQFLHSALPCRWPWCCGRWWCRP